MQRNIFQVVFFIDCDFDYHWKKITLNKLKLLISLKRQQLDELSHLNSFTGYYH